MDEAGGRRAELKQAGSRQKAMRACTKRLRSADRSARASSVVWSCCIQAVSYCMSCKGDKREKQTKNWGCGHLQQALNVLSKFSGAIARSPRPGITKESPATEEHSQQRHCGHSCGHRAQQALQRAWAATPVTAGACGPLVRRCRKAACRLPTETAAAAAPLRRQRDADAAGVAHEMELRRLK